jgi:2-amino-4-hydroxy-6-hydroxymethyldihydropteridine diphosphokinase
LNEVFLSLGSNVGNRLGNLRRAAELFKARAGAISARSDVYETPPWGLDTQPKFLNACIAINTDIPPHELLGLLKSMERELGRVAREHWGPREIDIDILAYGGLTIQDDDLVIPHPLISERPFVLVPLADIASVWKHPRTGETVSELLKKVRALGIVRITAL